MKKIYSIHSDAMFREAFSVLNDKMLAEDAVNESFVRIINNVDFMKWDNEIQMRNFLVIVCRNVARDMYRRRKYETSATLEEVESESVVDSAEQIVINRESESRIRNVIAEMNPIYRDVLILKKRYGLKRDDIANILGIKKETVTKRMQRAKAIIKKELREEDM